MRQRTQRHVVLTTTSPCYARLRAAMQPLRLTEYARRHSVNASEQAEAQLVAPRSLCLISDVAITRVPLGRHRGTVTTLPTPLVTPSTLLELAPSRPAASPVLKVFALRSQRGVHHCRGVPKI